MKFGIYTSFFNCQEYVDAIFNNIEKLNYYNFEWHITDDFSTDNTLASIKDRLAVSCIRDKIKYHTQDSKKEMYWYPNRFFDESFDWIVLVDADDEIGKNTLNTINTIIKNNASDIAILTTDFHKIDEDNGNLHSISYIKNEDEISKKIQKYHPECDYLQNTSYYCFGTCRAFKNLPKLEFKIIDQLACAEDSYRIFWMNFHGKYLHVPRALYKWNRRENSESHNNTLPSNFNANFYPALKRLQKSDKGVDFTFLPVYTETCSIQSIPFDVMENTTELNLISRELSHRNKEQLKLLYSDKYLSFDIRDKGVNVVCLEFIDDVELKSILDRVGTSGKLLLYYHSTHRHSSVSNLELHIDKKLENIKQILLENGYNFSWWRYIRHLVVYVNI